jgi:hypothetical protein
MVAHVNNEVEMRRMEVGMAQLQVLYCHISGVTETQKSVRTVNVTTDIQTGHIPHTKWMCYT